MGIDNIASLHSFACDSCSFGWKVELQCNNHIQDHYGNDLCNIDSSIGECKGRLCPRLEKITYFHIGNDGQRNSVYIDDKMKTPHQTRERARALVSGGLL